MVLFTRDGVERQLQLPTMAISKLLFVKDELVAAVVPAVFRTDPENRGFALDDTLLRRYDLDGKEQARWFAPEPVPELEPFAAALANEVAAASDGKTLFLASRHRRYRVVAVDSSGKETWHWLGPERTRPEMPGRKEPTPPQELAPEAAARFRGLDLPFFVRDVAVAAGLLWVLLSPQVFAGHVVVDVFPLQGQEPLARLQLNVKEEKEPGQLAVTKDALWLFPVGEGKPQAFLRPPEEMLQPPRPQDTAAGGQ
ncbi:hypothetical protein HRbin09_01784 [bacterium HR09]|nr:hypothetical protein HRbin09_01784 [bacterium HR09]